MSGVRVLLAEDEDRIRNLIVRYLENEGYSVQAVADGEQALDAWFDTPADLVILDVMMPIMDGWDVLSEIRKDSDVPVIMLTAKREEADRLQGFSLGTDDYITKPFSPRELVMRVKALLKRAGKLSQSATVSLSGLCVNTQNRFVSTPDGEIKLSAREFDLLVYMIDNRGVILSRDQLLARIWGYDYEGDARVVDTTIKRLRQKLGVCKDAVKTMRGSGYMFEARP